MKKNIFFCLLPAFIIFISSCTYPFDISRLGDNLDPQVVLNSMLTPDSAVSVYATWNKLVYDKSSYAKVEEFSVKLWEDHRLVLDTVGTSGFCQSDFFPKEGCSYEIELEVKGYGKVTASTCVPKRPYIKSDFLKFVKAGYYAAVKGYHFYELQSIETDDDVRSLIIRTRGHYDIKFYKWGGLFFLNSSFCDSFNAVSNSEDAIAKESNVEYEFFVRIPSVYFKRVTPLKFSFESFYDTHRQYYGDRFEDYIVYELNEIQLLFIAPSDEYDRYTESLYKQQNLAYVDPPIFSQIVPVYSNIVNGCGIFAGFSCIKMVVEKQEVNNYE